MLATLQRAGRPKKKEPRALHVRPSARADGVNAGSPSARLGGEGPACPSWRIARILARRRGTPPPLKPAQAVAPQRCDHHHYQVGPMFSTRLERLRQFRRDPARGRHRLDRGLGGARIQYARGGGGGSCADHNWSAHRNGRPCRPVPYRLRHSPGCRTLHIALMEGRRLAPKSPPPLKPAKTRKKRPSCDAGRMSGDAEN